MSDHQVPDAAVAAGASAEEREQLAQWCEEQIGLQRELMANAQQIITVYGHGTIGPDRDEAALRSDFANKFWRIAALLRATPAAPVGAPSELFEELRELDCIAAEVEADDYATAPQRLRDIRTAISRIVSASLPPVEGAGVEEALGPIEDCPECEGSGTAVLTADVAGQAASLKQCPHCKGTGKVRETIRWRNLPAGAAASDRDAARWRAVRAHLIGFDYAWGDPPSRVAVFDLPDGRFSGGPQGADAWADALLAQQAPQEGPRP